MKKLSNVFLVLTVLLSDVMCVVVTYRYCCMKWDIRYAAYSASPSVAFFCAVPYMIAIAICIAVAIVLKRKGR